METTTEKPNFTASAEAQKLAKRLYIAQVGETITYDELMEIAGGPLDVIRGYIATARRIVQREHQYVFDAITGVGIKRLNDSEKVESTKSRMQRVRKAIGRAKDTIASTDFNNLKPDEKREALSMQAQMGAMQLASSIKSQHLIAQKLEQGKTLAIGDVVNFFKAT